MRNQIDHLLIENQNHIPDLNLSQEESEHLRSLLSEIGNHVVLEDRKWSKINFQRITNMIRVLMNKYNGKVETLEQFLILDGVQRFHQCGQYYHGKMSGQGTYSDIDNNSNCEIYYQGEWKDGFWEGKGSLVRILPKQLTISRGEFRRSKLWNGKVFSKDSHLTQVHVVKNGKKTFTGQYDSKNRIKFLGHVIHGKRVGYGIEYDESGNIVYNGKYQNGVRIQ